MNFPDAPPIWKFDIMLEYRYFMQFGGGFFLFNKRMVVLADNRQGNNGYLKKENAMYESWLVNTCFWHM